MTAIEAIRQYFMDCPLLDADARINVNYIGVEPLEYIIYSDPMDPIYKRYSDGGVIKQYGFTFATLNYHSPEVIQQLENSGFYEDFSRWIEENNEKGVLPEVDGAQRIEVLTNGYLLNAEADRGQYQIQLKLLYLEV